MNYISTIIIFTVSYIVYYGICHTSSTNYANDANLERERLEDFCRYYKQQQTRNEK